MNELLAIIAIVVLCCVMFFAWLISMATCPDRMVTWISGSRSTQYNSSRDSKELLTPKNSLVEQNGQVTLQLGSNRAKRLSIVTESEENSHSPAPVVDV
uniref:Secreted protein n=1 Tax=Plectus sambesii TaxID=2011161 RepID=A0A914W5F2_9BILA